MTDTPRKIRVFTQIIPGEVRTIRVPVEITTTLVPCPTYRSSEELAREKAHERAVEIAEDAAREAYTDAYAAAFDDAYRDEMERST